MLGDSAIGVGSQILADLARVALGELPSTRSGRPFESRLTIWAAVAQSRVSNLGCPTGERYRCVSSRAFTPAVAKDRICCGPHPPRALSKGVDEFHDFLSTLAAGTEFSDAVTTSYPGFRS